MRNASTEAIRLGEHSSRPQQSLHGTRGPRSLGLVATMPEALRALFPILLGYLLGSIPFGYVVVKAIRGIDIREYGSHNIGATNVLRVVGWYPALLTLLGDIGKGAAPPAMAVLPYFAGPEPNPWVVVGSALAAI